MRVIIIRSNPVSPDPRVEKQANSLMKAGHEIIILGWDRQQHATSLKIESMQLLDGVVKKVLIGYHTKYNAGMKSLKNMGIFQLLLFKWLIVNKNSFDVIHACDFDTALPSLISSRLFNKKIVYDIFDYYADSHSMPKLFKKVISSAENWIINNSDAVIICNEYRKKQINKCNPKMLEIIHNTPAEIPYYDETDISNKSTRMKIVYVGTLCKDRFIDELLEIISNRGDVELHIGGAGILENNIKLYTEKANNIFFYGRLQYIQTLKLESECDIMIAFYDPEIAIHRYSAPNKLYEAMLLGKPIIVAKGTSVDNMVRDKKIGLVANFAELDFVEKLDKLINDNISRDSMGENAKKLYKQYSWKEMEARLVNLYSTFVK